MFRRIFARLEDTNNPLLGPTLWGLRRWGMWLGTSSKQSKVAYILVHAMATLFVLSQYIELWRIRSDLHLALRNLSISMLSTVCVVKAWTFVVWQKFWKGIIEYASSLEKRQLCDGDDEIKRIVSAYTSYSRKVTYCYWSLVTATVFAVILAPLAGYLTYSDTQMELIRNGSLPYPEIMSSWIPFDRTKGFWYWFTVIEQTVICFYGGGIVANYDANSMVLMSFFKGQLQVLALSCSRIFDSKNGRKQIYQNIRDCHEHHISLVKYAKSFNSLLSPVMFLYVIICSLMICSSAVQLNMEGTTSFQRFWILEYLIALIAQLFIYCWHSNDVLFTSQEVAIGVYKSNWVTSTVCYRRYVILLQGQLRKVIVFNAGPFTTLTVATFITILKLSYNYYTLLSNKD